MKYCEQCGWDVEEVRVCKKCKIEYCPDCESPYDDEFCLDCFLEEDEKAT